MGDRMPRVDYLFIGFHDTLGARMEILVVADPSRRQRQCLERLLLQLYLSSASQFQTSLA